MTVAERVRALRDEVQSRLDLTEEQMKGLASFAGQKVGHQTGNWEGGRSVPSEDKAGWIIIAIFDNAPAGHDVGDQSDEYTFGECRAYVLAPGDVLGPVKDMLVAAGDQMHCVKYRLMGNGGLITKAMDEDTFTTALCDEFEELAEMAGLGAEDDTWECPGCKRLNPVELGSEDEDTDDAPTSFCGGCGVARVEVVS
jgi:hypothetical protein